MSADVNSDYDALLMGRLFLLFLMSGFLCWGEPQTVTIRSTVDGAEQKALLAVPESAKEKPTPLVVHLHSWSSDYKNSSKMEEAIDAAQQQGWIFISPDFRGPNQRPEACGSDLAVQDVVDAVHYVQSVAKVDQKKIYLLGGSGGGHMSLLMAGRHPELWRAVSAWVPISDLADWHRSTKEKDLRYWKMLEVCTGGAPRASSAIDAEYRKRSPVRWLSRAGKLPIHIEVGIHDGHQGSVPVSQSLRAFNILARFNQKTSEAFSEEEIREITDNQRVSGKAPEVEEGRRYPALLRRKAGNAMITIFEGGHETDFAIGMKWLASH